MLLGIKQFLPGFNKMLVHLGEYKMQSVPISVQPLTKGNVEFFQPVSFSDFQVCQHCCTKLYPQRTALPEGISVTV